LSPTIHTRFRLGAGGLWDQQAVVERVAPRGLHLVNRVNYLNPANNINSPTFGRITSADFPRQIQLSVRYQF
jgi:hypothetical protein